VLAGAVCAAAACGAGEADGFVHVQQQRLSMSFNGSRRSTRSQMFTGNDGTVASEDVRAGHWGDQRLRESGTVISGHA
jgi:hypothetical protein